MSNALALLTAFGICLLWRTISGYRARSRTPRLMRCSCPERVLYVEHHPLTDSAGIVHEQRICQPARERVEA